VTKYLDYTFKDSNEFISTFDELPFWSAPFGLLLFKHLELRSGLTVIDIGSGAGFPLIELAERLGTSSKVYGLDPWQTANARARQKIKNYNLNHVEIIESSGEKIPLEDNSVDLIVSNLGINNFERPDIVFKECYRVLKTGGKLALTTNLYGHWKEFYKVFYSVLQETGNDDLSNILKNDEEHRGTIQSVSKLLTDNRFNLTRHIEDSFEMKFVDGTAFLNHHFIRLGWLTTWMNIFPKEKLEQIFSALEEKLNIFSRENGGLKFTVPMAYVEGMK
jgi:arsenite methyltransferase